jgi:2-oxoisovalerate dehydrogenase E1 component alpha subunit
MSDMTTSKPLSLRIPEPEFRPGCKPNFSGLSVSEAGSTRRSAIDVDPEAIRDLAHSMIRVLNENSEAVGPWAGLLSDAELLTGLRDMMKVRAYDARMLLAQRQGKASFYMQSTGEEAIATAFQRALEPGDMNFPTYRQPGLLIVSGYSMIDMMCQVYSNNGDPMKGRQLPVFIAPRHMASSPFPAISALNAFKQSVGRWLPPSRASRR